MLSAPPSRLPSSFARIFASIKTKFSTDNVDPQLKVLLDASSSQLYFDCANRYDYNGLCEAFGLPDYMSTWYKLTLMHCWMILLRLHVSLDANAYLRLQRGLLSTMWLDIDNRLAIVGEELNQVMTSRKDMQNMHGLHLLTFLEYDEGFLADDCRLAGALWRCLYLEREVEPVHVANAIVYIRGTVAWLDTLDQMDILVEGIKEWKRLPTGLQ